MAIKTLSRSFAGGEISPELFSRVDLEKYQTGLALCENAIVTPQGPIQNRPGFGYINRTRDSARKSRLLPFAFNTQQTFALEFGHGYIRFHTQGGTLLEPALAINTISIASPAVFGMTGAHGLSAGNWVYSVGIGGMPDLTTRWFMVASTPTSDSLTLNDLNGVPISSVGMGPYTGGGTLARLYEIASPYDENDLDTLHYVQSADVMTLVSPRYAPRELRRKGATNWELQTIQFTSSLSPPQSNVAIPNAIEHKYSVVAILSDYRYGTMSLPVSCMNDLSIPGRYNVVAWGSIPGAQLYLVYKYVGGQPQFFGVSPSSSQFIDDGDRLPDPSVPNYGGIGPTPIISATAVAPFSTGVSVIPTGAGLIEYAYAVTSSDELGKEESIASSSAFALNDLTVAGNYNTVRWPAVPGVRAYNVYRLTNGILAYVGRAGPDCVFMDANILPDTSTTPPLQINPFLGDGNFPQAVSYHEQRRVFAGTLNAPQTVWMTRSGTELNLGYSQPTRDDDSITLRVVSREANTIRHLVPMNELMLLTSGGEWKLMSADGGALTPSSVSVKQQGYSGASNVQPVVTNRTILFAQDRGGHIRELEFSWQQQGYQTSDVSILAPHLFDYLAVRQMAFSRAPQQLLWSVRSDGAMLGMTYVTEHEVRAWHRHRTAGQFESCCTVAEGDEDVLYVIVRREINGQPLRYVERLHTRRFDTPADQFFVDCGASYSGAPADVIGNLHHLEGETVAILADGGVEPPQVVVGGKITLSSPASKVHVGLPYTTRIQTLPISLQTEALGQGTQKNVNKVHVRVLESNGFETGPSFNNLRPFKTRNTEPYGSPPELVTDEVEIVADPDWNRSGSMCVQQANPVSLMVLGMTLEVAVGG
ncbi:hypothetical protein APR50_10480 [Variovorax paradoxus]|jgi:hypothetical protein|uniref:phage nozzle protein n=1 Tax=Variovorax paradoxus TaxID=34073 RepID=UPI0006E5F07F|nr:hypothetical protein APR50_10480 [Variovorax paradoxus]KPV11386.1 hypothetical protein APR49_09355 [Variovorax paradoxus]KPV31156.1 hypothetical protein APR48_17675 [Variovorax paradoxus]KPV33249.1 hypothetical protein APR47_18060 [Variovorax paradoxus]